MWSLTTAYRTLYFESETSAELYVYIMHLPTSDCNLIYKYYKLKAHHTLIWYVLHYAPKEM